MAAFLVVALTTGGWKAYRQLFFFRTPAFRATEQLNAAIRSRPLTPAEFAEAVALCTCGERPAELRALPIVRMAADRTPEYRPAAESLYRQLAADPSDPQRQAIAAGWLPRPAE